MKKLILTILAAATLTGCNANNQPQKGEVEPHMIAGSEARKNYCKRRHTHTRKDFYDCVKGYGGQHSIYSKDVVYPDNKNNGGNQ